MMIRRSLVALVAASTLACSASDGRPNILWITAEDMSPNLGSWGDDYALTPNLDRLAQESVRYTSVFATAPVCSPSRSTLLTGVYATSLGTQRLRSRFPIPAHVKGFPSYLRESGYYTTNNSKTDYNTGHEERLVAESWNESSETAHWRNREGHEPFFSVFNDMTTHQSRSMSWSDERFLQEVQSQLSADEIHDPEKAPVPEYYPNTPVVRETIARYYDCITAMDKNVGRILSELEEDGLADDTIVFFYSDHGAGLPRHKRNLHDSGAHVPLLVRFPEKFRHLAPVNPGESSDRLVSFIDFAPTMLSLLGLEIPESMQGRPFLGPGAGEPRQYVYGARDRIDEAYDVARSVRSRDYLYIRNYMPHLAYNQPSAFSDTSRIRKEIESLAAREKLEGPQLAYATSPRPREELYAVHQDPQQLRNLVYSNDHQGTLSTMRKELVRWIREARDVGFLPEAEAWARIGDSTPYEIARDDALYPQARITGAAALVGREDALDEQITLLADPDPAIRYWAALGLRASARSTHPSNDALTMALEDESAPVRIAAADALARHGDPGPALRVLRNELESEDLDVALLASRTIELLGREARSARRAMHQAAERYAQVEGDQALFIRFSTGAFLDRLGR